MAERNLLWLMLTLIAAPVSLHAVEARTTNERSVADNDGKPKKSKTAGRPAVKIDPEAELAATRLVQSLLPELKSILNHLRSEDQRQYNLAIRDLAKSARRLETAKNRDEELYEIEVELLQAQSSVRLLTAKLKVRDSESDRKKLRQSVGRLQQAELSRVKYDVRVLQERIERTKKSLDTAKERLTSKADHFQEQLQASYLGYLRKAGRKPDGELTGEK